LRRSAFVLRRAVFYIRHTMSVSRREVMRR
jgi:hypothetical protein